jgi:hypothetical protein
MKNYIYKVSMGSDHCPDGIVLESKLLDGYSDDGYISNDGYFYIKNVKYSICNEDELAILYSNNQILMDSYYESKVKKIINPMDYYINNNKSKFFNFLENLRNDGYASINYDGYCDFFGSKENLNVCSKFFQSEKINKDGYLEGIFYLTPNNEYILYPHIPDGYTL